MTSASAGYRLRVAEGFLVEAHQDAQLHRWRASVDHAQLAAENAAKAVLALVAPVARTHNPAAQLRQALQDAPFPAAQRQQVQRLAECTETLGFDVHVRTDYGDEAENRTPWELFGEEDSRMAVRIAEEAIDLAHSILRSVQP